MSSTNLPTTNENNDVDADADADADADVEHQNFSSRPPSTTGSSRNNNRMPKQSSRKKMEIRVSSLPSSLRQSIATLNLDIDGDGALDEGDIVMAVDKLGTTTKYNADLKKLVCLLLLFSILLIVSVFGTSIAAARLAKDTEVDSLTGIMYAKGGDHATLKTEDVVFHSVSVSSTTIMEKSNTQLKTLKEILLAGNDVKFQIKGYARAKDGTYITLLVEGGTIVFDINGLASATGDAKILLDSAFGEQQEGEEVEEVGGGQRRYLASASASASCDGDCGIQTASGGTDCTPAAPIDIVIPINDNNPIQDIQGLYICCGCGQWWEYIGDKYTCVGTVTACSNNKFSF
jgi:hypothetical protein